MWVLRNFKNTFFRRKCDFDKVAKQIYWDHTSAWVFSCKFAAYFQNTFCYEHLRTAASGNFSLITENSFLTKFSTSKHKIIDKKQKKTNKQINKRKRYKSKKKKNTRKKTGCMCSSTLDHRPSAPILDKFLEQICE